MILYLGKAPAKSVIQLWVKKFDEVGTIGDLNKASDDSEPHSG